MNAVMLKGTVTKEPTLRFTPNGWPIVDWTLVINGSKWDGNAREQVVSKAFVSCVQFGPSAELTAETLDKGDEVFVQGEIDQSEYTKKDGTKESKTKVSVWYWIVTKKKDGLSKAPAPAPQHELSDEDPF